MSLISYNGVTLPYPFTTQFSQEAKYDPSMTDWYCTRFDISVNCIINTNYIDVLDPTLAAGLNPAEIMIQIRQKLLKPRKQLSVKFNGSELMPGKAGGVPGTVDAQNGPQPQSCRYTMLTDTTFLMTYRIVGHYWENNNAEGTNQAGSPVLTNRWEETQDIDDCNYSTRTRRGTYILRSDNKEGSTIDAGDLRKQMAIVGVPPGFLRQRSSYTVDPSGLKMTYTVVDKEVFRKPPTPAFKAEGQYTERTTRFNTKRFATCRVSLWGDKETSQTELVNAAVILCSRKLSSRGQQLNIAQGKSNIIDDAVLTMDLFNNKVDFTMTVVMFPGQGRIGDVVAAFFNISDAVPTSDPDYTPAYKDRGTANMFLYAASYYDPNLANNALEQGGKQMNNGNMVGREQMAGNQE